MKPIKSSDELERVLRVAGAEFRSQVENTKTSLAFESRREQDISNALRAFQAELQSEAGPARGWLSVLGLRGLVVTGVAITAALALVILDHSEPPQVATYGPQGGVVDQVEFSMVGASAEVSYAFSQLSGELSAGLSDEVFREVASLELPSELEASLSVSFDDLVTTEVTEDAYS